MVADVINYHPFSKGYLRDPEEIKNFFFMLNDTRGNIYSPKLSVEPNRTLNLPILLNQCPPSLLYSVSQVSKKEEKKEVPSIGFKLVKDSNGKVQIKHMVIEE